ncbi:hypothetical protein YC2023_019412 [Brassica napus]
MIKNLSNVKGHSIPLRSLRHRSKLEELEAKLTEENWRFVTICYKIGALIDVSDKKGQTPLMHDVKSYKTKVFSLVSNDEKP